MIRPAHDTVLQLPANGVIVRKNAKQTKEQQADRTWLGKWMISS